MAAFVREGDWSALESAYHDDCAELAPAVAMVIRSTDLADYRHHLVTAVSEIKLTSARAVYWEFDPDNGWSSAFFLCNAYQPEGARDDEWAADFDQTVPGPELKDFALLYDPSFSGTAAATARNLYLFARTFAAFGTAIMPRWKLGIPLCAGYHDQANVFRVVGA